MSDPKLMILAGGVSSRMKRSIESRTDLDPKLKTDLQSKSKTMINIGQGNRPFLDYLLFNARAAGYQDVLIIISERDTSIRQYYGTNETGNRFHGLTISYAVQKIPPERLKPLGTADAVLQGMIVRKDWSGRKFTVCNGDNLYSRDVLLTLLESRYPNAMIDYDRDALGFDDARIDKFAIVRKDDEGFVTGIIEKPDAREIEAVKDKNGTVGVSMNIFRLDYDEVYRFVKDVPLHPVRAEKELPAAIAMLVREHPRSMYAFPFAELVPDMTSIVDVDGVSKYLEMEYPNFTW